VNRYVDVEVVKQPVTKVFRWNRFILYGDANEHMIAMNISDDLGLAQPKGKKVSKAAPVSFLQLMHASERSFITENTAHIFETTLEPSFFTTEKYCLYQRYLKEIHHDDDTTLSGFRQFLVDSPLENKPIPYTDSARPGPLPLCYGSYHQMYRLDGELIAMAVLDILPNCVSSVFFMYDKKWEKHSLGKLSALREACLAKEMHDAGAPGMNSLYMGFYIHSCVKMRYKGDYSPSYLADPEEFTWHPLKTCVPMLNRYRYACFVHPEHSLEGSQDPGPEPVPLVPDALLPDIKIVDSIKNNVVSVVSVTRSKHWTQKSFREEVYSNINGLGIDLSKDMILYSS